LSVFDRFQESRFHISASVPLTNQNHLPIITAHSNVLTTSRDIPHYLFVCLFVCLFHVRYQDLIPRVILCLTKVMKRQLDAPRQTAHHRRILERASQVTSLSISLDSPLDSTRLDSLSLASALGQGGPRHSLAEDSRAQTSALTAIATVVAPENTVSLKKNAKRAKQPTHTTVTSSFHQHLPPPQPPLPPTNTQVALTLQRPSVAATVLAHPYKPHHRIGIRHRDPTSALALLHFAGSIGKHPDDGGGGGVGSSPT
jgi:hypothetical protein